MKKIFSLLLAFSFCAPIAWAQTEKFTEETMLHNGVNLNVFSTKLSGNEYLTYKTFRKYLRKNKVKLKHHSDYYEAKEVYIPQIIDKRADIVCLIFEKGNHVEFKLSYKLGYDVFLTSATRPDETKNLINYLSKYSHQHEIVYHKEELGKNKKDIKETSRDSKKLKKKIKQIDQQIAEMEKAGKSDGREILQESIENYKGIIETNRLKITRLESERAVLETQYRQEKQLLKAIK